MKVAKLSLATMVICGLVSSSFAADTLEEAFKNGKVNGILKAYYFNKDTDVANASTFNSSTVGKGHAGILTTGIELTYVTDSFYGFNMGATFQSSSSPFANEAAKNMFGADMYGPGAVLSEGYLQYKLGKTNIKLGRQYIRTPLVNGSASREITESFEGVTVTNTDIPDTTLMGGYLPKFQGRTKLSTDSARTLAGGESDIPDFGNVLVFTKAGGTYAGSPGSYAKLSSVVSFDAIYMAYAQNTSIENLKLIGQYVKVTDVQKLADVDMTYLEANYLIPMNGFSLGFDTMMASSQTGSALDAYNNEGTYIAGRVKLQDLKGFGLAASYGTTTNSDAVIEGIGNGPFVYTATFMRGPIASLEKNTDSYSFEVSYDFNTVGIGGLKFIGIYAVNKTKDAESLNQAKTVILKNDEKYTTISTSVRYEVPAVKGLNVGLEFETQEKDTIGKQTVTDEWRFRAQYKF